MTGIVYRIDNENSDFIDCPFFSKHSEIRCQVFEVLKVFCQIKKYIDFAVLTKS